MRNYRCLVVDDEPIARDIIKTYCSHLPSLLLVADCGNALEAKSILCNSQIDILFLDIHMPVLDGIGFLKTLKQPPQVIFTTAYKEHAAQAFDLAACDYLVKPFSLDRFIVAVDKAQEKFTVFQKEALQNRIPNEHYIFIKANGKIYKVQHDALYYAEAFGNYTKIYADDETIISAISFSAFEQLLPCPPFIRTHRSFIVNQSRIHHIEGNRVSIKDKEVPIGNNYRDAFFKTLGFQK